MSTLDNYGAQKYTGYKNDVSYHRVTGILVLPCSDGAPVTSRVHQQYGTVVQVFAGSKTGAPPLLPKPASNETVLSYDVALPLPVPGQGSDGIGYAYSAAGQFTILQSTPSTELTGMAYPSWPFRLEPMTTMAEMTPSLTSYSVTNPNSIWNNSLTLPPQLFSADI